MSRHRRIAAALVAGALLTVAPTTAQATTSGPGATASRTCSVGDSRSYGTTYVRWIKTRNVGCRKAKSVVRAFHACRAGARGRCGHKVKRFKCSENRNFGRGSFDSTVVCKRGGKRVRHGYTQWT